MSFEQITRPLRSFAKRDARMTNAQQRAFETLLPRFSLSTMALDKDRLFGNSKPVVLEIGFGNGESLLSQAQHNPHTHFIGIEMYRPGIGHLLLRLQQLAIDNVKIIYADAAQYVGQYVADQTLDKVQIFFPDPWPKKRHHKRRLIQTEFTRLLAAKLKPGACLHLATDWQDYAEHMLAVLTGIELLQNCHAGFAPRPDDRPITKFERRGQRLGHGVWDLLFQRL